MKTESSDLFVMKMIYRLSDEASKLETAQKLASELRISPEKALNVLNRYPGPLIKPMSRQRVEEIANSFIRVGVPVEVIAASTQVNANPPSASPAPTSPQKQPVREIVTPAPLPMLMEPLGMTPLIEPKQAPLTPVSLAPALSIPAITPLTSARADSPQQPMEPMAEMGGETTSVPSARTSLQTKLVASSLVPVLFIGISALSLLAINLPRGLGELNQSRTEQLISAVVLDLDPSKTKETQDRLREITQYSAGDLSFAELKLPGSSNQAVFVTKDPQLDGLVGRSFAAFTASPAFQVQHPVWNATGELAGNFEIFKGQVFESATGQRTIQFGDPSMQAASAKPVGKPVLEFAIGSSNAKAQSIITQQISLMVALIALVLLSATMLSLIFSRNISNAIIRLTTAADTISLGEFDVPVERKSNDELGDLAESLDRMRISLRSALERLRRRR